MRGISARTFDYQQPSDFQPKMTTYKRAYVAAAQSGESSMNSSILRPPLNNQVMTTANSSSYYKDQIFSMFEKRPESFQDESSSFHAGGQNTDMMTQ